MDKFKTKKSLGQNFLEDNEVISNIIDVANLSKEYNVLEIGPGQGAITTSLIKMANKVLSVELDHRLIEFLNEKYKDKENFKLLNKDFLETKKEDFTFINDLPIKMVANLPYYITTPIILKTLMEYKFIEEVYVMVQKEVALRFTSEYKNKTYGSISVFLQTIAEGNYEFTVKSTSFNPPPKIDSAIISLKRKDEELEKLDFEKYEFFLKGCFKQKRKLLSNNIAMSFGLSKENVNMIIEELGFVKTIRPEEITVKEYINMYEMFLKKGYLNN